MRTFRVMSRVENLLGLVSCDVWVVKTGMILFLVRGQTVATFIEDRVIITETHRLEDLGDNEVVLNSDALAAAAEKR